MEHAFQAATTRQQLADAAALVPENWGNTPDIPESIPTLWNITHRWADVIAFATWQVNVGKDDKAHGEERVLRTGATAACTAGNRLGLPDVIRSAPGAKNLWAAFAAELQKAKSAAPAAA